MPDWDETFDVVVVGAGAAGLTAALSASANGLRTLVIEKAQVWGGSCALSGGGVWIPCNPLMQAAGANDTPEAAAAYLEAVVPDAGPATSKPRRAAYLQSGPEMIGFLLAQGVAIEQEPGQPDYHAALPGGRAGRLLEPALTDGRKLGPWLETLRPAPRPFAVKTGEGARVARAFTSVASATTLLKAMGRDRLMRLAGRVPLTSGAALAAQLMMAAQRAGVTVRLGAPLRRLVVEQGRVVGVEVGDAAAPRRIGAPAGVVLCGGGFARNPDMRRALQPVDGQYSSASPDDTGDAITAAREVGAALDLLEEAWWGPCVLYPGDNPGFFLWERSLPGSLMVDGSGRRFANESQSYDSLGREMLRQGTKDAWLIIDARHRRRYVFGAMPPGRTPQAMFDSGFFRRADTLEQLAKDCGLDPQTVAATVARFNGFARTGVDEDFGRGVAAYDNYWGDPTHKPNHNLGALLEPPFLATRVHLGDLGTKGGVVTDEDGRALRADGSAIEGLFAAGNCTASVMGRGYPGPGATLGPAMTFAYRAARRAAAERVRPAVAA